MWFNNGPCQCQKATKSFPMHPLKFWGNTVKMILIKWLKQKWPCDFPPELMQVKNWWGGFTRPRYRVKDWLCTTCDHSPPCSSHVRSMGQDGKPDAFSSKERHPSTFMVGETKVQHHPNWWVWCKDSSSSLKDEPSPQRTGWGGTTSSSMLEWSGTAVHSMGTRVWHICGVFAGAPLKGQDYWCSVGTLR